MTAYTAYQIFEHLRDTGTIEAAGELLGRGFAKGLADGAPPFARLITAAPELLAALREMVPLAVHSVDCNPEEARCECGLSEALDRVRAAIAKAVSP